MSRTLDTARFDFAHACIASALASLKLARRSLDAGALDDARMWSYRGLASTLQAQALLAYLHRTRGFRYDFG